MKKNRREVESYRLAVIRQMVELATAGFGLVAALAWNEFIRNLIDAYIKPRLGENSGIVSLLIYAVVVTILAVFVTSQLSKLAKRLERKRS